MALAGTVSGDSQGGFALRVPVVHSANGGIALLESGTDMYDAFGGIALRGAPTADAYGGFSLGIAYSGDADGGFMLCYLRMLDSIG